MLRAMDSAVAGLRAHQNKMDVVGHNIANVNTFGYKAQNYTFKEAMYQTSTASTAGTLGDNGATAGGTNAAQYGYGTLMGSIGMDMTASTPSYVGGFNASIEGQGFFMTSPGPASKTVDPSTANAVKNAEFQFTRVGQFMVDSNGYIVDANKNFIFGYRADEKGEMGKELKALRLPELNNGALAFDSDSGNAALSTSIEINAMGVITATVQVENAKGDKESKSVAIGQVAIAIFQNPNGLTKAGGNYYKTNADDNAGQVAAGKPGDAGLSTLMSGYIEASNVDLAKEFADMITTHRGFQANSKMITVSDEMLSDLVAMKR